jgi:hypothetical protein
MYPFSVDYRIFVVARPKYGVLEHVGLLFPDGSVLHCTPERGTHRSPSEDFAQGWDVRIVRELPPHLHNLVHQRAYWIELNPRRYDLVSFNCHDLVNWLTAEDQKIPAFSLNR